MNAEGWYLDPYGIHENRWYSDGQPTALVRDGGVEAQDEPPSGAQPGELEPVPDPQSENGTDLKRAGEATNKDQSFTQAQGAQAVLDGSGVVGFW